MFFCNRPHPSLNVLKALPVRNGIDEDNACSSFVVDLGDVSVAFLPSSVPNLEFDFGFVKGNGFDFKVNPDGGNMSHLTVSISESEEDVGLSNS